MTVNELIKELQNLVKEGHGSCEIVNGEGDNIHDITVARPYRNVEVIFYFS